MQREITQEMAKDRLPRREADANKGSFGSVLAAAGSMAYRGAAALCTEGALRAGAGLVYLASVEPVVAALVGVVAFGEPLSWGVVLGLGCILTTVYLLR